MFSRHFLLLVLLSSPNWLFAGLSAEVDFAGMRDRWRDLLTGSVSAIADDPAIRARVEALAREVASNGHSRDPVNGTGLWDKMNLSPDRTYLWHGVGRLARGPQFWVDSLRSLERLSLAAATPGSPLYQNPELIRDVLAAVDWIIQDFYNPDKIVRKGTADWWQLEIGVPLFLAPICIELYDQFPPELLQRCVSAMDAFNPEPAVTCAGTGADRPSTGSAIVNKNRGHLAVGVLKQDPAYLDRTSRNLERLFVDTTSGDGFYPDGSFIMHRIHPYNGGYGLALLSGLADYGSIVSGTPWAFDESRSKKIRIWVERGLLPFLWRGQLMSLVRGREIARWDSGESRAGSLAAVALLRMTRALNPAEAAPLQKAAAAVLVDQRENLAQLDRVSPFDLQLAERLDISEGTATRGFFAFPAMDRAVYHTPAWAAALAMHSVRTGNAESINGENRRAWHTGSGALFIYRERERPYGGDFWATVDSFRIPGTTVESAKVGGFEKGTSALVGSLEAPIGQDGSAAGLATMTLPAAKSNVQGRKTWFFLPDAIVQLLAGVSGTGDASVETIVENRLIRRDGPQAFLVNGFDASGTSDGGKASLHSAVKWAWLEGSEQGGLGMGWFFYEPSDVHTLRETRTDSWRSVNTGSTYKTPETLVTERFQTIWLDHGVRPFSASAVFAALPDATAAETEAFAKNPPFVVLANTVENQAVRAGSLTAASFGSHGGSVGEGENLLTASGPALLALRIEGKSLALHVCDPTQPKSGNLVVTCGFPVEKILTTDPAVTVIQTEPTLRVEIRLDGLAGGMAALHATR